MHIQVSLFSSNTICLKICFKFSLFATLIIKELSMILQCKNDEEVVAVIAHELGHWKLNHTMYSFIALQVCLVISVLSFYLVIALGKLNSLMVLLIMSWLHSSAYEKFCVLHLLHNMSHRTGKEFPLCSLRVILAANSGLKSC